MECYKNLSEYLCLLLLSWCMFELVSVQCLKMVSGVKHPCAHNGEFEVMCCWDTEKKEMLEVFDEASKDKIVAFVDPSGSQGFNKMSYPNYNFTFNSPCGKMKVKNLVTGNLTIYCVLGSKTLEQYVEACPASRLTGTTLALNSTNEFWPRNGLIIMSLICVALVCLIFGCSLKQRRCILRPGLVTIKKLHSQTDMSQSAEVLC